MRDALKLTSYVACRHATYMAAPALLLRMGTTLFQLVCSSSFCVMLHKQRRIPSSYPQFSTGTTILGATGAKVVGGGVGSYWISGVGGGGEGSGTSTC